MARRDIRRGVRRTPTVPMGQAPEALSPRLFPFDRRRHEQARGLLGVDTASSLTSPATISDAIDLHLREYEHACRLAGLAGVDPVAATAPHPLVTQALERLADVEERYLVLIERETGHDAVPLAELAVVHRRQLARSDPTAHRALLGLSLVLLTHQLHATALFADAAATAQEAIDVLGHRGPQRHGTDVRPALVLALDASTMVNLSRGRRVDAAHDLVHATVALDDLTADRPAFGGDLRRHLGALSGTLAHPDLDDDVRATLRSTVSHLRLVPPVDDDGRHRPGPAVVPDVPRSEADDLYDTSAHLMTSAADGPAAAAAAGAAVAAYRRLLAVQPAERWPMILRRLARALWRHALILNELLGRPRDALGPGREALTLTRRALRTVEHDDHFDDLIGQLGVTLHDVAHIARTAGLIGEYDQAAEEAVRLRTSGVGADALRTLGAALHGRAADACETTVALVERGHDMGPTVAAGVHTSGHAIGIRRTLLRDDDPMTFWELANSQLANGHLWCLAGDGQAGAQAMADAHETVATLPGAPGRAMRDAAGTALLAACASYPDIVPRADWPL